MTDKAHIIEIFSSIQGEGPLVGYKQLFIRFSGCNLNCNYCDTEFTHGEESRFYSAEELCEVVKNAKNCHSVSLTGGEPLLHTEFLKEFMHNCALPIYLETNATLPQELEKIIDYIEYISADIKLPSCTNLESLWDIHDKFFEVASGKNLFAKIVFDKNITKEEVIKCCEFGSKYGIELILQPKMINDNMDININFIEKVHNSFLDRYKNVRVIPQTHKFINAR